jgi:hypothetical protein
MYNRHQDDLRHSNCDLFEHRPRFRCVNSSVSPPTSNDALSAAVDTLVEYART